VHDGRRAECRRLTAIVSTPLHITHPSTSSSPLTLGSWAFAAGDPSSDDDQSVIAVSYQCRIEEMGKLYFPLYSLL